MKKITIILLITFLAGCVAEKEETPVFEDIDIPRCNDLIKQAAMNLTDFGVNKQQVQTWMDDALTRELQPCNECQSLNDAAILLKDKKGIYKAAMAKLINAVETVDPDSQLITEKQVQRVNNLLSEDSNDDMYSLAGRYIDTLDLLEEFMVRQMRIDQAEAKNFILDTFIIPLMEQEPQEK